MLLVGLAYGGSGRVGVEVILLLAEHESALVDVQDVHLGVLLVGSEAYAHGHAVAERGILELQRAQVGHGLGSLNLAYERHGRGYAFLVAAHGVHGQLVEVAQFLLCGSGLVSVLEQVGQDGVDTLVVVKRQLVKAAEARIGGRQWVLLHPSAACVLVEVFGRLDARVEVGQVDARFQLCLRAGRERRGREEHNGDNVSYFHNDNIVNVICNCNCKR